MLKRILLVEDDQYITLALKIRLQAEGYEVDVATATVDALRVAIAHPPEVALIDYNLPDGTGFDVIQAFSRDARTMLVNSVIMTASKQPGLREKAFAAGAIEYLEKPFKSSELIRFLRTLTAAGLDMPLANPASGCPPR